MNGRSLFVNALTFLRVPLIFAWLGLAITAERTGSGAWAVAACAAMLASGLTDLFDGRLARKWQVVSALGKMADPLMDKVFYVVAFPGLLWLIMSQGESSAHAMTMLWFTILYLLRDLWVTFLRSVGVAYGADVAAMWLGKVRTALSFPAAGWVYVYLCAHRLAPADWNGLWLASVYAVEAMMIVINLVSFVTYTRVYSPWLAKALGDGRRD